MRQTKTVPLTLMTTAIVVAFAILAIMLPSGTEASSTVSDNCKVVLIGASYAKDWPMPTLVDFSVINKGIGGNQSFEMANRFHDDVITQGADTVIIWGFINDIFRSPVGQIEDTRKQILESYSMMISSSLKNGITPIISTEVSIREPHGFSNWVAGIIGRLRGKTSYQSTINGHVSAINSDLLDLAAKHNVTVLDFYSVLSDRNGMRRHEFSTEDGSHISSEGYAALSKYLSENVVSVCQRRN